MSLPQKRNFRQRAHCNPLNDNFFDSPIKPSEVNWNELFPHFSANKPVTICDLGCGYGGLLLTLSEMYPEKLSLGIEIRDKVSSFVREKISGLREINPGNYENIGVLKSNAMKYLPNYIEKHQLEKIFFCFPDPHFKKAKHRWRIISRHMLDMYGYVMKPGAKAYTITDVEDLHEWMKACFDEHPSFRPLKSEELEEDVIVPKLRNCTEEGQKVERNGGKTWIGVYEKLHE